MTESEKVIELGGKRFTRPAEWTMKQDAYLMKLAHRAGLDRIKLQPGETAEDLVDRLLGMLLENDLALEMLGGMLMPEGWEPTQWGPDVAREIAKHLENLTAQEDKTAVRGLISQLLIVFFRNGIASLRTSPSYSGSLAAKPESDPTSSPAVQG